MNSKIKNTEMSLSKCSNSNCNDRNLLVYNKIVINKAILANNIKNSELSGKASFDIGCVGLDNFFYFIDVLLFENQIEQSKVAKEFLTRVCDNAFSKNMG